MRTTVTVADRVWRRARAESVRQGLSWREYLARAIEEYYELRPGEPGERPEGPRRLRSLVISPETWR